MKKSLLLFSVLLCGLLTACGERAAMSGWYLRAENGADLLVTEGGEPYKLSDRSRGKTLFQGLDSGDRVEITHGAVAESYPGQTEAYTCKLLEDGSPGSIPEETLAILGEMGYAFDFHSHVPAEEPLTVEQTETIPEILERSCG